MIANSGKDSAIIMHAYIPDNMLEFYEMGGKGWKII
jgi:hypothetical protein